MTQLGLTCEARRKIFKSMPKGLSDEDEYQTILSENLRDELHKNIVIAIGRPIFEYKNEIFNVLADNPEPPNCYRWRYSPDYAAFPREDAIGDWSIDTLRTCYMALQKGYLAVSVVMQQPRGRAGRWREGTGVEDQMRRDIAFAASDDSSECSSEDSEDQLLKSEVPSSSGGGRASTISQARRDIIQKTKEVFAEYIEKTTGLKEVEFPKVLRGDGSSGLPGWYWKFSNTGDFQMMPLSNSFSNWKTIQLEAAVEDLGAGVLRLCRKQPESPRGGRRRAVHTSQNSRTRIFSLDRERPVFDPSYSYPSPLEENEGLVAKETVRSNSPLENHPSQTPLQNKHFIDLSEEEEDGEPIQSIKDTEPMNQGYLEGQGEFEERDNYEVDNFEIQENISHLLQTPRDQSLTRTPPPEDQDSEELLLDDDEYGGNKFMQGIQDQIDQRQSLLSKLEEAQRTITAQEAHIKELDKQLQNDGENQAIRVVYGNLCADVTIANANMTRLEKANIEKDGEITRLREKVGRLEESLSAKGNGPHRTAERMKGPHFRAVNERSGEAAIRTAHARTTTSSTVSYNLLPRVDLAILPRSQPVAISRTRQLPVVSATAKRSAQQATGYTMHGESNNNRSLSQSPTATTVNIIDANFFSPPRKRRRAAEYGEVEVKGELTGTK